MNRIVMELTKQIDTNSPFLVWRNDTGVSLEKPNTIDAFDT